MHGQVESEDDEHKNKLTILKAAFRALQEGWGFGLRVDFLTVGDYAEILRYVDYMPGDTVCTLSTTSSPLALEHSYQGLQNPGQLYRLGRRSTLSKCDVLESLIITHQYILAMICGSSGSEDEDMDTESEGFIALTSSTCRYCVRLPALGGMQDFLRMADDSLGQVKVGVRRGSLYAKEKDCPRNASEVETYGWGNTILCRTGEQNEAMFVVYTLLPSMASGLVAENIESIGIYITITEELVRGHTGNKGCRGKYYEWAAPLVAGYKSRRVNTFFLTVGCSLVVPCTYAVRIGAHSTEEVVVFVHAVQCTLTESRRRVFMTRPKKMLRKIIHESGNGTDFVGPGATAATDTDLVLPDIDKSVNAEDERGILGTIPSVTNVPLNNRQREKIVRSYYSLDLGHEGVAEAYRRTPVIDFGRQPTLNAHPDGVNGELPYLPNSFTRFMVEDVPFRYYERVMGGTIEFPFSLRRIWELDTGDRSSYEEDGMSQSDSTLRTDSDDDFEEQCEEDSEDLSDNDSGIHSEGENMGEKGESSAHGSASNG